MIVPSDRHYFNAIAVFDDASIGDVFNIDSGLGGSHTIIFCGKTDDGKYEFHQQEKDGWPARTYRFDADGVLSVVYILLPESSLYLEWNMEMPEVGGKQYAVEKTYGVVWVEDTEGYFRFNKKNWSLVLGESADVVREKTNIVRKRYFEGIFRQGTPVEKSPSNSNLQVSKTILEQLGGRRFIAMTGARDLIGGTNYLMFRLPRGLALNGINKVKITLDWTDTYVVEALRLGPVACESIEIADTVYAEDLQLVFTRLTGLDTHL